MALELEFNEETHTYYYGGVVVPSVTQILSGVGLYDLDFVSRSTLEVASERGRKVHTYVEWHTLGILDEDSIDPELRGYYDAYLKANIPEPKAVELRVHHRTYGYAGTLDQLHDGWINDIKTGIEGIEHGLQLTAYWLALYPIHEKPKRLTCTYLSRDGEFKIVDYKYEPYDFLAVLADYKWRLKNNKIKPRWR